MTKRQALVTGATGFVGSNLVRHLLKAGWGVDVIIRHDSKCVLLKDCLQEVRVHEHVGTSVSMQEIVDRAQPDVVFHVASFALGQHRPEDIDDLINANLLLGTHLAEALRQRDISAPIVNTGTYWQHYESNEYNPVNLYAATKQAYEDILKYYVAAHGIRVITLKLHDTYGPNDPRSKLLNLLKDTANSGKTLMMSPGEQLIDLVHVADLANAYLIAAERLLSQEVGTIEAWSVASGSPVSLKQLVELVEDAWGCQIPVHWGGRKYREREVMIPWAGKKLPGWEPRVPLEDGLKDIRTQ